MDAGRKHTANFSVARVLVSAILFFSLTADVTRADWPTQTPAGAPSTGLPAGGGSGLSSWTLWSGVLGAVGLLAAWVTVNRSRRQALPGTAAELTTLARLPVGPRQSIVLLRCGKRRVLVGITPQQFTALGDWPEADAFPAADSDIQRETLLAIAERLGISDASAADSCPPMAQASRLCPLNKFQPENKRPVRENHATEQPKPEVAS